MRIWAALLVLAALVSIGAPAFAQTPPPGAPGRAQAPARAEQDEAPPEKDARDGKDAAAPDRKGFENSRLAALFFWIFAGMTIVGSLFVITRRNLIAAVMGMVGTFFALAGLYAMLYAHFLAAIQVLVYAGAIMVLFVFVVMILNRPEDEPWALQGLLGKALAGLAIAYLVARLSGVLWGIKDQPHAEMAAPSPQPVEVVVKGGAAEHPGKAPPREDAFGSTRSVGKVLFSEYLFPFEAVSLVLLVAVVGGIAVARPHQREDGPAKKLVA